MKTIKTNKQGISLIVLVITIIVMIILASAIILSLNNSNIINNANKAVEITNLAQVKHIATLKWSEAYLNDEITDIENYILIELKEEGINTDNYDITVTEAGVDVVLKGTVPNNWKENVIAIVDTVPIPKGFVASPYNGENTKNDGLVIYELSEEETEIPDTETQYTSWTTRNQYVWVPVDKENFATKFVRQNFGMSNTLSNTLGTEYWEVMVNKTINLPLTTMEEQGVTYMSDATLAEVQAMYASVKEYGGFYIARYEAGIDTQRTGNATIVTGKNVYSKMNKIPYTYIKWGASMTNETGGVVEVARGIYPANNETNTTGVVSTLTYGVQWDTALQWWLDTKAVTSVTESTNYGNYSATTIEAGALNEGAKYAIFVRGSMATYQDATAELTKASGTWWGLSTGALKAANVNNIYDMAGNMGEWTMEAYSTGKPISRGAANNAAASRAGRQYDSTYYDDTYSFRIALYIKN